MFRFASVSASVSASVFALCLLPIQSIASTVLLASAGDSITAGFIASSNAEHTLDGLDHKADFSWASGEKINSHLMRWKNWMSLHEPNKTIVAFNVARSGAKSTELTAQAHAILNEWNTGKYSELREITVLIGANDACHEGANSEALSQLRQNLESFMEVLSVLHLQVRPLVLFSTLPDIPSLARPEIFNYPVLPPLTCRDLALHVLRDCTRLLSWRNDAEYRAAEAQVIAYNRVIEQEATKFARLYPQFEIRFSQSVYRGRISISDLAKDCFHPNFRGQERISEVLWRDIVK